ncbi:helix-turn-helix domain-containing protein [Pseudidiomarina aestuarii]|uniref:helix-turn-helix domain-containing protein n=1 Tax=Pseudidiomarina aestuarii TaxID=624146 RepID=UPI003A98852E
MSGASFHPLVIDRCLELIKAKLKDNGVTYQDIAALMDVSENTVKRMLNQDDISLQRLLLLADYCRIDVTDLLQAAQQGHGQHHYFTPRQDQAFADDSVLYELFVQLFFLRMTAPQAAEKLGLNQVTLYQKLRLLEDVELIELGVANHIRFLVEPPLGFAPDSLVLRRSIAEHVQRASAHLLQPERDARELLLLKPLHLPPKAHQQLCEDIIALVDKYAEFSELYQNETDTGYAYELALALLPNR